jgi:hypothetical protein
MMFWDLASQSENMHKKLNDRLPYSRKASSMWIATAGYVGPGWQADTGCQYAA